jgi:glutathione reductase (NADPH)
MAETFDVVVIGTGTAASQMAYRCRAAGKSVAVVDSKPFGGTCALRGCDPKKVLVGGADLVDWANRMRSHGIEGETRIDWSALMKFKRSFTDPVPERREQDFEKAGIEPIHGRAKFSAPDRVSIDGREIVAGNIGIGVGMRPVRLGIPGAEFLIDSEQFLNLDRLPERIVFVGAGYIAFEFGHLAARAGARVTLVSRGARPLAGFDPDLAARLLRKTRELGIRVELNSPVTGAEPGAIYAGSEKFEGDLLVHAAGREPDVDDLDLKAGNVESGRHGIKVNEFLQSTSNPAVYAAGDCADTGNPALTPVAGWEGRTAGSNMVNPRSSAIARRAIPSVVFSIPPMAKVGLTEAEAVKLGLKYVPVARDMSGWYSSRRIAEDCSGSKILIEEGSGRILGAHLLGEGAEEVINVFSVAIGNRMAARDLASTVFSYPSRGSDIPYMVDMAG